ncbi:MAG: TonB-dependent receptor [Moraxellaceae bacterium]|jgi:iron complex outermembrane receptor protein|nr:TonB-dependent receptor [Moraxellaceae bacterium]
MKTRIRDCCVLSPLLLLSLSWLPTPALAEGDLLALPFEDLARLQVSIATGTPRSLASAPAAATVITARELDALGVRDIGEALEAVPGLHVSNGSFQYAPRYFIRGITSSYNPHTLVLVNGLPQTSLFLGDRGERIPNLYSLPVQMLERIEIIRGPGSALYGADAFAGVINLITKSPLDEKGGELSVSAGSFATHRASLLQSVRVGGATALVSAAWLETDGDSSAVITSDAQSNIDDLGLGPAASLAPAPVPTMARAYDLRGDLLMGDFRLRLGWMEAWDTGAGQGLNQALDTTSRARHHRGHFDLGWSRDGLVPDWRLEARLSYLYSDNRNNGVRLYPAGAFFGSFPDGVWARPNLFEENARADLSATHTGLQDHVLRLGAGFYWGDLFKSTTVNNYILGGPVPVPRPAPRDVSDTPDVFQPENQRTSHYLFAQDEWNLAPDWSLTTGLRYDRYSDVGTTLNPRLSLVWNTSSTLTSKLMYGEAFRAPAFFELYGSNNPVALGNPALKPEKLRSTEFALGWKPLPTMTWDNSVFYLHIHDFIDFESDPGQPTFTARNSSHISGQGLESELRQQFGGSVELLVNYSKQRLRKDSGAPLAFAPREEAHLRTIWKPAPRWQLTPQLNWIGEREREAGDRRAPLQGYLTADLALRHSLAAALDLGLVARNLGNTDVREPSRGPGPGQVQPGIRNDLPQAGRSLSVELKGRW